MKRKGTTKLTKNIDNYVSLFWLGWNVQKSGKVWASAWFLAFCSFSKIWALCFLTNKFTKKMHLLSWKSINIIAALFEHSQNSLKTLMRQSLKTLETPYTHSRNTLKILLKHFWNTYETRNHLKHFWNTLETILKHT